MLLLTMHHIVSDGWSMGVFNREPETLYKTFCVGQSSARLPTALSHRLGGGPCKALPDIGRSTQLPPPHVCSPKSRLAPTWANQR